MKSIISTKLVRNAALALALAGPLLPASEGAAFDKFKLLDSGMRPEIFLLRPTFAASVDDGVLSVETGPDDTRLVLRNNGDRVTVTDNTGPISVSRSYDGIQRVKVKGWVGNDRLDARRMRLPVDIKGGLGNDRIWGGSNHDRLNGQHGDDYIYGGAGRDAVIGGPGRDRLYGNSGDDWLVGIDDGRSDYLSGNSGRDVYWVDVVSGRRDSIAYVGRTEQVQAVTAFANADRTLNGDDTGDPLIPGDLSATYVLHENDPLWDNAQPDASEVDQNGFNNCKVISAIAAVAHNTVSGDSWPIRRAMADFGDGTFGVALGDRFYRIDAELAHTVDNNDGSIRGLRFVGAGRNGAIWVPILEKALALHDSNNNGMRGAYDRLRRTSSAAVFQAFGSEETGTPIFNEYANNATDLGNKLWRAYNNYDNVTLSLVGPLNSVGGGHAYSVHEVIRNNAGTVTRVRLRNPWGRDGNANGYSDGNANDGLVTYTIQQLWNDAPGSNRVNWGTRID